MACGPRQLLCPCCSLVHLMFSKTELGGYAWSHDNCRFLLLTKSCSASDLLATWLNWILGLLGRFACVSLLERCLNKEVVRLKVGSVREQLQLQLSVLAETSEEQKSSTDWFLVEMLQDVSMNLDLWLTTYKFANSNVRRAPRSVVCSWTRRLWKGCWFGLSRRR